MTQRAGFRNFEASLSEEFGKQLALKKTGKTIEELTELMGVYKKGPRKGLIKGYITWMKLVQGGWARTSDGSGYVAAFPMSFMYSLVLRSYRAEKESVIVWDDDIRCSCQGIISPEDNYLLALKRHKKNLEQQKIIE